MPKECFIVAGGQSGIGRSLVSLLQKEVETVFNFDLFKNHDITNCYEKKVDLNNYSQLKKKISEISNEYSIKGIAVVAGIGYITPIHELDSVKFSKEVQDNLHIVFNMIKASLPYLVEGSSIVTVSSTSIYGSSGNSVAYAAAKAGVIGLTKSLAMELSSKNIRVNCVVPGAVNTQLFESLTRPTERRLMKEFTPLKKIAEPVDVANSIQFLLCDKSKHITGQSLVVDGGLSMAYKLYL
ncbi:SDR family NAD(P)-dependent oxidoreductase [Sporosarcina limicola]|uniref:3-oxoacyl-[acyl-carrier protein] reductase n=1 Tax=Sporosarcina limicola TaxID=34101 RepID=A0A927MIR5_9BACL|nr:SDR family oxidoreductase [Sporosarcina limicola]MBE1555425.1 3-oxoacyl-[acyl-carrier protein] reductase [Sporosarcina limicola]